MPIKRPQNHFINIAWIILIYGSWLLAGCQRQPDVSAGLLPSTNSTSLAVSNALTPSKASDGSHNGFQSDLDVAAKLRQEREQGKPWPLSFFPLPNFETGAGRPRPVEVNFYSMKDKYPDYLLCQYDVEEPNYNQVGEAKWFNAALKQIRELGPSKFPPVKWVVVMIENRADNNNKSTFEQSYKVAGIFKADDVFDHAHNLTQLVASAEMDRHPFKYDLQQPTPGEQQRWMIVERHAMTNHVESIPAHP